MEVRSANEAMYQPEGAIRDKTAHVKLLLRDVGPIDAHAHIFVNHPALSDLLKRLDLSLINVTVIDPWERGSKTMEPQRRNAIALARANPLRAPWIATSTRRRGNRPGSPNA